jgi:hypothetical protein
VVRYEVALRWKLEDWDDCDFGRKLSLLRMAINEAQRLEAKALLEENEGFKESLNETKVMDQNDAAVVSMLLRALWRWEVDWVVDLLHKVAAVVKRDAESRSVMNNIAFDVLGTKLRSFELFFSCIFSLSNSQI